MENQAVDIEKAKRDAMVCSTSFLTVFDVCNVYLWRVTPIYVLSVWYFFKMASSMILGLIFRCYNFDFYFNRFVILLKVLFMLILGTVSSGRENPRHGWIQIQSDSLLTKFRPVALGFPGISEDRESWHRWVDQEGNVWKPRAGNACHRLSPCCSVFTRPFECSL